MACFSLLDPCHPVKFFIPTFLSFSLCHSSLSYFYPPGCHGYSVSVCRASRSSSRQKGRGATGDVKSTGEGSLSSLSTLCIDLLSEPRRRLLLGLIRSPPRRPTTDATCRSGSQISAMLSPMHRRSLELVRCLDFKCHFFIF